MRKKLRFLAAFLLVFLLAGCGAGKAGNNAAGGNSVTAQSNAVAENEAAVSEADKSPDMAAVGAGEKEERSDAGRESDVGAGGGNAVGDDSDSSNGDLTEKEEDKAAPEDEGEKDGLPEDGTYTSKEDVALYIHLYGRLPSNFITKKEAESLGWTGGSLEPYAPGMCIGGSRFGNYEGLLPEKDGRVYTECDIDTLGAGKRGAKRIVFSNDGLIYYTEDHYQSFALLYGEE